MFLGLLLMFNSPRRNFYSYHNVTRNINFIIYVQVYFIVGSEKYEI